MEHRQQPHPLTDSLGVNTDAFQCPCIRLSGTFKRAAKALARLADKPGGIPYRLVWEGCLGVLLTDVGLQVLAGWLVGVGSLCIKSHPSGLVLPTGAQGALRRR